MKSRGRFSADELKHIGFRIRAVRILTGLNQEEFSKIYGLPYISLKNWEQGKFTPRSESIATYLMAIESAGIRVDPDWLYFGSGPGPIYLNANAKVKEEMTASELDKNIAFFKEQLQSRGLNPVISHVDDNSMLPVFKRGDLLGGMVLSRREVLLSAQKNEMLRPFLILDSNGNYSPRRLFISNDQIFTNSYDDSYLCEYKHSWLAKICWYTDIHNLKSSLSNEDE